MDYYILSADREIKQVSRDEWIDWHGNCDGCTPENNPRTVGRDEFETDAGGVSVSTVFLPLDHNFTGRGRPVLFETMIFSNCLDEYCVRSCTWAEAEAEHRKALEWVTGLIPALAIEPLTEEATVRRAGFRLIDLGTCDD